MLQALNYYIVFMIDGGQYKDGVSDEEVAVLLLKLYEKYGYDFRSYSQAHLKRRLQSKLTMSGIPSITTLQDHMLASPAVAASLLRDLSVTVTEMYRDPEFYRAVREIVIPMLKTYSFLKIWHAGCSTGQEVYSMAILLMEEGLYDRTMIYATDFNQQVLDQAKEGVFTDEDIRQYTRNHQLSGGITSLSDYYMSRYNRVIMDKSLKKNIVWANHNLVTDGVFAEVQLIMCRNVLIYFNKDLQNHVHELFYNSLGRGGFLCLGAKESLRFSSVSHKYSEVDYKAKIYSKKY
ncbi:MAG TPA: protein-glutamate O-methyltransferase CheR [Cytophagales bacterium]|nr:protein-glutamate O-methyltransferase CheR [Cytophagales bacterium]